ncbi:hypothetical protein PINS_up020060 [Pythium insidiosum]|nr:hypothetical protein PINS_up020060 [Pythium insidiosum]
MRGSLCSAASSSAQVRVPQTNAVSSGSLAVIPSQPTSSDSAHGIDIRERRQSTALLSTEPPMDARLPTDSSVCWVNNLCRVPRLGCTLEVEMGSAPAQVLRQLTYFPTTIRS